MGKFFLCRNVKLNFIKEMNQNKEIQTIYIRMLEGVETFIPVNAKFVGDNVFEIISNKYMNLEEDATCIYEFFPSDVVRCEVKRDFFLPIQKRKETFLLATKLLSSTFPNRKVYQLIFLIVKSLGEINRNQLQGFEDEIRRLYFDKSILQRQHPLVKKWLEKNR